LLPRTEKKTLKLRRHGGLQGGSLGEKRRNGVLGKTKEGDGRHILCEKITEERGASSIRKKKWPIVRFVGGEKWAAWGGSNTPK